MLDSRAISIWDAGRQSYKNNLLEEDNPYDPNSLEYEYWSDGLVYGLINKVVKDKH